KSGSQRRARRPRAVRREAHRHVAAAGKGLARHSGGPRRTGMIPAEFAYYTPASLDETLALLGRYGDGAKLLAGGHSLLPALKLRLTAIGHLVDLGRISNLRKSRQ